jgi:hypothetical protein
MSWASALTPPGSGDAALEAPREFFPEVFFFAKSNPEGFFLPFFGRRFKGTAIGGGSCAWSTTGTGGGRSDGSTGINSQMTRF